MIKETIQTVRAFDPGTRQLRWFGIVLAAAFMLYYRFFSVEIIFAIAGLLVLALAALYPRFFLPFIKFLLYITYPIGWVFSRIVLALIFYVLISPIGILQRVFGKDPLALKTGKEKESFWHDVEENVHHDSLAL